MGSDEVHARPRATAAMVEHVARRAQGRRQRGNRRLAAPEIAYRVAELVVPLGPAGRKSSHLVAAGSAIPRLGNQLHAAEGRVLAYHLEKPALLVEAVMLARQNRSEIEAEAV